MIDFSGKDEVKKTFIDVWEKLRMDLAEEKFKYNELDQVLKTTFFSQFVQIIERIDNIHNANTNLNDIKTYASLLRGANLDIDEKVEYSRFIPNKEKFKAINRFSPEDKEYLYLSIDFKKSYNNNKDNCIAEIRAKEGNRVAFCEFEVKSKYKYLKIINLTSCQKTITEYEKEFQRLANEGMFKNSSSRKKIEMFFLKIYLKMLSEYLFCPIKTDDKKIEYSPFHCMANYFESIGYSGIIYESTVNKGGKNLVLFDKNYVNPINEIIYE